MLRGGVETMMLGVDDDDARSRCRRRRCPESTDDDDTRSRPTTAGTNA
jgi:hypothetical protein